MSFDKKVYREIKKQVAGKLSLALSADIYEKEVLYLDVYVKMLPGLIHDENYEAAQAIKDAILEFIKKNVPDSEVNITRDTLLKIPEYKPANPIRGIICFEDPENTLKGGTAKFIDI